MTTNDKTVEPATEWLRNNYQNYPNIDSLCEAMRASLTTPSKEPAGAVIAPPIECTTCGALVVGVAPLTSAPAEPAKSLTDAQIDAIAATNLGDYRGGQWHRLFARAVLAACEEAVVSSHADELYDPLPGMWEQADFLGGATSAETPPASGAIDAGGQTITKSDVLRVAKEIGLVGWISDCGEWFEFTETRHPSKLLIRFAEHYAALASHQEPPAVDAGEKAARINRFIQDYVLTRLEEKAKTEP